MEFVCPPNTFVRTWDGRADETGLYALGITCSDGTFVGSVGVWAAGEEFTETTQNDGYSTVVAKVNNGVVTGVSFRDRQFEEGTKAPVWGSKAGPDQSSSCGEDERIVGIAIRGDTTLGNVGTFRLLCGLAQGEAAASIQGLAGAC
jgi:hypothetical protein